MTPITLDVSDLPTAFNSATCVQRGLCPVTKIRGKDSSPFESHSLYFERHGTGTEYKVLFIMGLNSSSFAWGKQVEHFGDSKKHSILVFDNRGVGNSGYPRGPYSTSEMAEDVIALLDHVGWTAERDFHVVSISLGGMIAQELAWRIPERIISLVLAVTTPGGYPWQNLPPLLGLRSLTKLIFLVNDPEKRVETALPMLFPQSWLDKQSEDDPTKTNFEVEAAALHYRIKITKPQKLMGHLSQMVAGFTHRVTPDRLAEISKAIPKIIIVTGDDDHLIDPRHSFDLHRAMPEAEFIQWKETGHAIHTQHQKQFNQLLQRAMDEGIARLRGERTE